MFINYKKLAKELAEELKSNPELLKCVFDVDKAQNEIMERFIDICLDDLIKLKRIELLEEANQKDFVGEMRVAVKARIEKEIKNSINKILEV